MATMVRLLNETGAIVETTYSRKNDAEIARLNEYEAALKVQAWFKGSRTRAYIRHLNHCATDIQRRWRGFLGRRAYRLYVKNCVLVMKLNYYNALTTRIQKVWRGYYVRKYVFNYYSRKRYLEALQVKNEIIRSELSEFSEQQEQQRQRQQMVAERRRQEHLARKNHYLISTEVMPGVYNSPFLPYPTETEYMLRSVKPLSHKKKKVEGEVFDPAWKSYSHPPPKQLPPIPNKPQGPFRSPEDVQKQRYKSFQPSLRVATSFLSLEEARQKMKDEEWVTRLNDNIFVPFKRREYMYQPMLHTKSPYGHLPFGTKFFRHEYLDQHIVDKPFKTLVPPIPVFDKLNDTYSQGQV